MTRTDLGLYVYGLVAADARVETPAMPGVDPAYDVGCFTHGDVHAIVSRVSLDQFDEQPLREHLADMSWVERIARHHQSVLDAVLGQATPIPMRLCTLYKDEDGLREMLDREQDGLSAALRELRGKLEWGVQVFAPGASAGQSRAAGEPRVASGTAYLQNKLAARTADEEKDADLERLCDQLHAELCASAEACRLGVPQRPEVSGHAEAMILNAFYLVRNEQRPSFRTRVEELGHELAEQGIDLQLTGPWAPYNFVPAGVGGSA